MGIQVEFNPDLALRDISEYTKKKRKKEECIPTELSPGKTYPFLKRGQRNYWLYGELPLVETKGNQNLSSPRASVVITEVRHALENGEVWTRGYYKVIEVFKDKKVHFDGFSKIKAK